MQNFSIKNCKTKWNKCFLSLNKKKKSCRINVQLKEFCSPRAAPQGGAGHRSGAVLRVWLLSALPNEGEPQVRPENVQSSRCGFPWNKLLLNTGEAPPHNEDLQQDVTILTSNMLAKLGAGGHFCFFPFFSFALYPDNFLYLLKDW